MIVNCTFLNPRSENNKLCVIDYGSSDPIDRVSGSSSSSSFILLPLSLKDVDKFYFIVTASNGSTSVKVEGTYECKVMKKN